MLTWKVSLIYRKNNLRFEIKPVLREGTDVDVDLNGRVDQYFPIL